MGERTAFGVIDHKRRLAVLIMWANPRIAGDVQLFTTASVRKFNVPNPPERTPSFLLPVIHELRIVKRACLIAKTVA